MEKEKLLAELAVVLVVERELGNYFYRVSRLDVPFRGAVRARVDALNALAEWRVMLEKSIAQLDCPHLPLGPVPCLSVKTPQSKV